MGVLTGWSNTDMCSALGGDATHREKKGGKDARVNGTVHLEEGTELVVLVGRQGFVRGYSGGGGGGESCIVFASNSTPLGIAGGGGRASREYHCEHGQAGEAEELNNGTVGQGGLACVSGGYFLARDGGPGGGLSADGTCCNSVSCEEAKG